MTITPEEHEALLNKVKELERWKEAVCDSVIYHNGCGVFVVNVDGEPAKKEYRDSFKEVFEKASK